MENTSTGRADDLPTILGIARNDPISRRVINFSSGWHRTQKVHFVFVIFSQGSNQ
jgi:hypothetical protein